MDADVEAAATLTDLPTAVQQEVLRLAGLDATAAAAVTCRGLHAAAAHPPLWQTFFAERMRPLRSAHDDAAEASSPHVGWQCFFRGWASGSPARTVTCAAGAASCGVTALAFAPGGALYASYEGGCFAEWDAARGVETSRVETAHGGASLNALVACGPATVATGGVDNAVRLWDVRASPAAPALHLPDAHAGEVFSLASLRSEADAAPLLASGGGDEYVRVWDARFAADALLELEGCAGTVFSLAYDAAAHLLYAGARREICLFSLSDGEWLSTLDGHSLEVYGLALGATRLLSCSDDGRVCVWDRQPPLAEGEEVEPEQEPVAEVLIRSFDGDDSDPEDDMADVAAVTCLVGLGQAPSAFLAGTWEGDVALGQIVGDAARMRRFGHPLLRGDDAQAQRYDAVTALAARDAVVAVGHNSGAMRLMMLDDPAGEAA